MKPRTKLEYRIVELSEKLQPITNMQINYAYKNCFAPVAYRTKKTSHCLECGHSFATNDIILDCPLCGVKLNYHDTRKRKDSQVEYFCIVNKVADMLVLRMFIVYKYSAVGSVPHHSITEVVQNWIDSTGRDKVMARKTMYAWGRSDWCLSSEIELRNHSNPYAYGDVLKYKINPIAIYPHRCTLPILKRNGFKGDFYNVTPIRFISQLINESQFETLLKAKQYDLLRQYCSGGYPLIIWRAIKICIRNNYIVKDAIMWRDYVDKLIDFKKDVRNAKYLCPKNLRVEHDKLVAKDRAIADRARVERDRQRHEQDLRNIAESEETYQLEKKRFMDLCIKDGDIQILPLQSVEDFKIEGDALKHCVFTGRYYKRRESLILSARKADERLETVEVSLDDFRIIQCQGPYNKQTKYHDQIVNIINNNIHQIRKRINK